MEPTQASSSKKMPYHAEGCADADRSLSHAVEIRRWFADTAGERRVMWCSQCGAVLVEAIYLQADGSLQFAPYTGPGFQYGTPLRVNTLPDTQEGKVETLLKAMDVSADEKEVYYRNFCRALRERDEARAMVDTCRAATNAEREKRIEAEARVHDLQIKSRLLEGVMVEQGHELEEVRLSKRGAEAWELLRQAQALLNQFLIGYEQGGKSGRVSELLHLLPRQVHDHKAHAEKVKKGLGVHSKGEPATGEPITGEPITGEPITGEPHTGEPYIGEPDVWTVVRAATRALADLQSAWHQAKNSGFQNHQDAMALALLQASEVHEALKGCLPVETKVD